jgi:hypothetical protein
MRSRYGKVLFLYLFIVTLNVTIKIIILVIMIIIIMLRRIFGPKRDEETGGLENCTMRSFITCTLLQI